ncbi:uncharacterized protein A4U43_C01F550 [Asparagus officinalis]|uniref:BHLH domain-containing protein n=1 Tax=Asparagus officinalis TaxID=4686 RepID=A0A5P1FL71_ASPOF|nr:uncharacterized protein LOC109845178 [Asparagus officinalis]ONK78882.1 uncharacterized protein A4U43_C01F550 [Asparagus officinalis]
MEEAQRSKRRRVYSFDPDAITYTNSSQSTENEGNTHFDILKRFEGLQTFPAIHRPVIVARQRISEKGTVGGEKELACCIRKLQKILPGGNDMGISELLSEVESYVVCLKLQVYVLRSLVDAQS